MKIQGQADIELNEYGKMQAYQGAEKLKNLDIRMAFSSPLSRARETAEIMLRNHGNVPIYIEDSLKEISYGIREGQSLPEIHQNPSVELHNYFHDPAEYFPPEAGESLRDLKKRCRYFLEKVLIPLEDGCAAVFTHGAFIRGIISVVEDLSDAQFWDGNEQKNCAVTELEYTGGRFFLLHDADFDGNGY